MCYNLNVISCTAMMRTVIIVVFYLFINRLKEDIGQIAETGCILRLVRVMRGETWQPVL